MLEHLLGGTSSGSIPSRPLTAIELRLVEKIVERITHALEATYAPVVPLKFRLEQTLSNPLEASVIPPGQEVFIARFDLRTGGAAGIMNFCLPQDAIQLTASAVLAQTTIKPSELKDLRVGDVILLEPPIDRPLTLVLENGQQYPGRIGHRGDKRIFQILPPKA